MIGNCFSARAPYHLIACECGLTFYAQRDGDGYRWTEDSAKAERFPSERAAVLVIQRRDFDNRGALIIPAEELGN